MAFTDSDKEVDDVRHRVLVLVERSMAPNYQEFLCPNCDMPVAQLHNSEILGLSDIIDFDSRKATLIGVPHKGRLRQTSADKPGYCRTRYYFTLGELL